MRPPDVVWVANERDVVIGAEVVGKSRSTAEKENVSYKKSFNLEDP